MKKFLPMSFAAMLVTGTAITNVSAEELDASDILTQSNEAMLGLESYESATTIEQTMQEPLTDETITTTSQSEEQVILDPFTMHQTVTTSIPEGEDVTLETYWTDEGFYTEDPEGGWMVMPEEFHDDIQELMELTMAEDYLAHAEALGESMEVEEIDNTYVLTYEGDGEALLEEGLDMEGMGNGDFDEAMDFLSFNDLSFEMTIDQDTHYMTELTMDMEMDMDLEGETVRSNQSIDMSLFNFNGVDSIEVPEDVVNEAVPMDDMLEDDGMMEDEEGGELPDTATNNGLFAMAGALTALTAGGLLLFRKRLTQQS